MATLTSITFVSPSAITDTAQIHVVITGDTSQGNSDGSSYKANLKDLKSVFVDTYTTGFTYNNSNTFTIKQNQGQSDLTATFNTVTGLTVSGAISATTIYSNGSELQNITWVTRTNTDTQLYNIPATYYGIINRYTLNAYSEYVLPASCLVGDIIEIVEDKSASSITRVRANTGQTIRVSTYGTTTSGGYFDTVNSDNVALKLMCITQNTKWAVVSYFSDCAGGVGSYPTVF